MTKNNSSSTVFFLFFSLVVIVTASSYLRVNNVISEVSDFLNWNLYSAVTTDNSALVFNRRLCSTQGDSIIIGREMTFTLENFDTRWHKIQKGVFNFEKGIISFFWHQKQNFDDLDLPSPDIGKIYRSEHGNIFLYYFGNTYSNIYCSSFLDK